MDFIPSSSSSAENSDLKVCKICGQTANGTHYGVVSCRACAAFFRRAESLKTIKACNNNNNCTADDIFRWAKCKKCRLRKCYAEGMSTANFQFHRDSLGPKVLVKNLPNTFERFVGRPHFVLSCSPEILKLKKDVIDCHPMIEKAWRIIELGSETPYHSQNRLLKLATGLRQFEKSHSNQIKILKIFGQNEFLSMFEKDFLKSVKYFTYLNEFRLLESDLQTTLIQGMWHAWTRLHKLSVSALGRRRGVCDQNMMMLSHNEEYAVCHVKEIKVDTAWCSNYTNEQMNYFTGATETNIYQLTDEFLELKPNDVELSYMMCELSFQYAGQRFQGEILEFCEKMMSLLADDLHDYYVKQLGWHNYAGRLAKLMRMNNKLREDICKCRQRQEIANIFNVYKIDFSHLEIFKDA